MKIYKSIEQFLNSKIEIDNFIPTMGNLHEGHLSLIDKAKENTGNICVSIYVNESQFNNQKDFDNYPITLDLDVKKLKSKNIEYLLIPNKFDIEKFSNPFNIDYAPNNLIVDLCGKYRPGHFLAVIDIVHRFLQIINPKNIILGEKDFQQIFCIRELISISKQETNITISPTIRNKHGLALSSRNAHLSNEEKILANNIYGSLILSKDLFHKGSSINEITEAVYDFHKNSLIKLEYFAVRDLKTLQHTYDGDLIALIAAYISDIRLIDNIIIRSNA